MKIILKSTKQIKQENENYKKKQARVINIVLQKFTKELSIFGALSRGCRFCDFLLQKGHFNIIILCFHYREQ